MAVKDYEARVVIGQRLAQIREEEGYTIEQIAEISKLTPSNIARIEEGRYNVGLDALSILARSLGKRVAIV